VQLDCGYPEVLGCIKCSQIGIDEQCHPDSRLIEAADCGTNCRIRAGEVEATFGGQFLAPLRDDGDLVGTNLTGQSDDIVADRQLEVADGGDSGRDGPDIMILDVAPILTQVDGDAVGSASRAASAGSGSSVRRAWRTVAM
jgi:hypothetical protein